MKPQTRRDRILEYLRAMQREVRVEDLAELMRVSSLTSGYGFHNLLGAMYLQMFWLVAVGEKHIARCRHCGRLINLTARAQSPGGGRKERKPRRDKRFCNDACRQRHHQEKQEKL